MKYLITFLDQNGNSLYLRDLEQALKGSNDGWTEDIDRCIANGQFYNTFGEAKEIIDKYGWSLCYVHEFEIG